MTEVTLLLDMDESDLGQEEINTISRGLQTLNKIRRELNQFKEDYKIFKEKFILDD